MATVQIDITTDTPLESITSGAGGAITNDVRVTFKDTVTEEQLVLTLTRIRDAILGKNQVSW